MQEQPSINTVHKIGKVTYTVAAKHSLETKDTLPEKIEKLIHRELSVKTE